MTMTLESTNLSLVKKAEPPQVLLGHTTVEGTPETMALRILTVVDLLALSVG
jgi:hypothetical protein